MHLPTVSTLHHANSATTPVRLEHDLQPTNRCQARLRDRLALVPRIDLDAFRFEAVVDWIEFEMRFSRGVQIQAVQPVLVGSLGKQCHVDPLDRGPGGVFRRCRITVQEPERLARVLDAHHALVQAFGERRPSRITGIEISVDAYPRVPSPAARAMLLGTMQRTFWTTRDIWSKRASGPRFAKGSKRVDCKHIVPGPQRDAEGKRRTNADTYSAAPVDATMYVGAQNDTVMTRIMDKIKDKQRPDGTCDTLTEDRKRVRIEVTLKGTELDELRLTDVPSLATFRLTKLQGRYFQFKLATFEDCNALRPAKRAVNSYFNARDATIYHKAGVLSLPQVYVAQAIRMNIVGMAEKHAARMPRGSQGQRRQLPLMSFDAMNRKVATAFQKLDQREQRAFRKRMSQPELGADGCDSSPPVVRELAAVDCTAITT